MDLHAYNVQNLLRVWLLSVNLTCMQHAVGVNAVSASYFSFSFSFSFFSSGSFSSSFSFSSPCNLQHPQLMCEQNVSME